MTEKKISVIMPVYNAAGTLKKAIQSVLNQSWKNIELLLIDDGSQDDSVAICRSLAEQDEHIRLFTLHNEGPAAARNIGLDAMTGELVAFVDSDDYLELQALANLASAIQEHDLALAHFYFDLGNTSSIKGLIDGNRALTFREYAPYLVRKPGAFYYSALWNKLFRADVIRENHLRFDSFFDWGEDFDFNIRYDHFVQSVAFVQEPTYHYVKNLNGASMKWAKHLLHSCQIKARLYRDVKHLFQAKGCYQQYRFWITWYIFYVTMVE